MRAVLQRVRRAGVAVDGEPVAAIGAGLVVLLGVGQGDAPSDAETVAGKIAHLRVFDDESGQMNRSVLEVAGEVLVVSQFTLYGDCRWGRRPSYSEAAAPAAAQALYEDVIARLRALGLTVRHGVFRATMQVELVNDGPVTLLLDTR
jgi:D-tyrosyl-tRNA(Tyr) deacylase